MIELKKGDLIRQGDKHISIVVIVEKMDDDRFYQTKFVASGIKGYNYVGFQNRDGEINKPRQILK